MKKSLILMLVFLLMCIVTAPGFAEPLEEQSVELVHKAAAQGNDAAQTKLGTMYYEGKGVPQDYQEAAKWLRKSAEQGNAVGQWRLGAMYYDGKGFPQNYIQAYKWFSLAAAKGNENAAHNRDVAASKMTPEQIAEAQRLANEWLNKKKKTK